MNYVYLLLFIVCAVIAWKVYGPKGTSLLDKIKDAAEEVKDKAEELEATIEAEVEAKVGEIEVAARELMPEVFSKLKGFTTNYAWRPEVADHRDKPYAAVLQANTVSAPIAPFVDILTKNMPVENQGSAGSCVGHSVTANFEHVTKMSDRSRLFVYWYARAMRGWTDQDSGCYIRDAVKVLQTQGVPAEALMPYNPLNIFKKPSAVAVRSALPLARLGLTYVRLNTLDDVLHALSAGRLVSFGFAVPEYFQSYEMSKSGYLPPIAPTAKILGGHAVLAVGYDLRDPAQKFVWVRNSWGPNWGPFGGYFKMDVSWFDPSKRLVDDMWTFVK